MLGDEVLEAVKKADASQRQEIQAEIDLLRWEKSPLLYFKQFCFLKFQTTLRLNINLRGNWF